MRALLAFAAALAVMPWLASAAGPPIPRTPSGRPDLLGTWDYGTVTPLQRPRALAEKAFFTPAEAREQQTGGCRSGRDACAAAKGRRFCRSEATTTSCRLSRPGDSSSSRPR